MTPEVTAAVAEPQNCEGLPDRLVAYALDVLGETDGRAWLDTAPTHAKALAQQEGLVLDPVCHPQASRSLVWMARRADQSAVVRVDLPGVLDVAAARLLAEAAAAPPLLVADPETSTSIVELVPGEGAEPGNLDHTRAVADVLPRLRAVDAPDTVESFPAWVHRHAQTACRRCPDWSPAVEAAASEVLHAAAGHRAILTHGDLVPGNVIITPSGEAALIDPEPHAAPLERDAVGWAHRTALMADSPVGPHLDAMTERLDLDPALASALMEFSSLTYAAYRRFRAGERPPAG